MTLTGRDLWGQVLVLLLLGRGAGGRAIEKALGVGADCQNTFKYDDVT